MKELIDRQKTMDRMGVKPRQMLEAAKGLMTDDQYTKLLKAYRQQVRLQIWFLVFMVLLLLLSMLLLKVSEKALMIGVLAIVLSTLVWSVLSPYLTGAAWRKYIRWYREGQNKDELSKIFC